MNSVRSLKGQMDYRVFVEEQREQGTSELETAARWWDHLAEQEILRATWDRNYSIGDACASTYRRTAEALRIQERTGVAVCSCCHKPLGEGCLQNRKRR